MKIKNFDFYKYKHALYLLIIPVYLIIFFLEEKYITTGYLISYMPLDDLIPFSEWFVLPYLLWYPLMLGTGIYLFFFDVGGFKNYIMNVGVGLFVIVVLYAIFPNGQDLRPSSFENSNILTDIVKLIYQNDTNTNVCPSIHVYGTMAAMFAIIECKKLRKWWLQTLNVILTVSIYLSTVFIKQHSILDVFTGIAMGLVAYLIVYKLVPVIKKAYRKRKKLQAEL